MQLVAGQLWENVNGDKMKLRKVEAEFVWVQHWFIRTVSWDISIEIYDRNILEKAIMNRGPMQCYRLVSNEEAIFADA